MIKIRGKVDSKKRYPKETWVHLRVVDHLRNDRAEDLWEFVAHVPNGGYRPIRTAMWMKRMGQKPGLPDLMIYLPCLWKKKRYIGLCLELKRMGYGTLSDRQKEWAARLEQQGWLYVVAYGLTSALSVIEMAYPPDALPVIPLDATLEERKAAVIEALQHPQHRLFSNRQIARQCGLGKSTVHRIRGQIESVPLGQPDTPQTQAA